jgi:nucleoid-associated protein YgaU
VATGPDTIGGAVWKPVRKARQLEGEDPMSLRDKYAAAIQVAKTVGMQGAAEERDGRLQFKGTVKSEEEKNRIWDALKTVPSWKDELNAQIDVAAPAAAPAASARPAGTTYTVVAGDTLSKIAKTHLGDANAYMKIFEANRDKLSDPDKIQVGQVLTIPQA